MHPGRYDAGCVTDREGLRCERRHISRITNGQRQPKEVVKGKSAEQKMEMEALRADPPPKFWP
jgi:hypothetical protein